METKTCPYCRTVNEGHAILCINCNARIGELPQPGAPQPGTASPGTTSPGVEPSAGAPRPEPSDPTQGWGSLPPPAPGLPPSPEPPPQPRRSNSMMLLVVAAAAIIVGAGVVLFLVRGGGRFPDELNGHPRSDSELAQQIEEAFSSFDIAGVSVDVALYGESDDPVAMMMLMDGLPSMVTDVPSEVFFQGIATSMAQQQGLGLGLGEPVQASANGADFVCLDAPASALAGGGGLSGFGATQDGAFCVFKGETIGMIFLMDGTGAAAAMAAVQTAYGEIA